MFAAGVLTAIEVFFERQTHDLLPEFFPQLWTLACEHGWEALIHILEDHAHTMEGTPGHWHNELEDALATMSSRGVVSAAHSLLALLRHAASSLRDTRDLNSLLRDSISNRLQNFEIYGCMNCRKLAFDHASWILQDVEKNFAAIK